MKWINKRAEVLYKINDLFSANVGLLGSGFNKLRIERNAPNMHILSADIPNYTPFIYGQNHEIDYHICGYDYTALWALERLMGECVERYSSIISSYALSSKKNFCYKSIHEIEKEGSVLPLKYLNVYSNEFYKVLNRLNPNFTDRQLTKDDKLEWFLCKSFLNQKMHLPSQMFFQSFNPYNSWTKSKEKRFYNAVSTGTATHVTQNQALLSALVETIQIHNFNKNWYYGFNGQKIIFNNKKIQDKINFILGGNKDLVDCCFVLYQDNIFNLYTIGVFVIDKKKRFPCFSFGVQADSDLEKCIERGLMEALAVYSFNYVQFINFKDLALPDFENVSIESFMDLEKNVLYFGSPQNYHTCEKEINKRITGEIKYSQLKKIENKELVTTERKLAALFKKFQENKIDFFYHDITPPEVMHLYRVVRVFVPDFIPVLLPSAPLDNHFALKIKDRFINPLA